MAKKTSFKRGTVAQKARSKVAESLKKRGLRTGNAFAFATYILSGLVRRDANGWPDMACGRKSRCRMPDDTNIESLQAQIRQRLVQDTRESAVRACLDVLAPDPGDIVPVILSSSCSASRR